MKILTVENHPEFPSLYFERDAKIERVMRYLKRHFEEHYSSLLNEPHSCTLSFNTNEDHDIVHISGDEDLLTLRLETIIPIF